ncbi:MAG: hypothetical protein Q8T09_15900 [Candidatus Melainabacteria bacterium]|nr:hypothetical protein [Candidatus Melainabacteria bacterium]
MTHQEPLSEEQKWELLTRPEKLGELLLKRGKISLTQLEELIEEQNQSGEPLGKLILARGLMTGQELLQALDMQHKTDQVIIKALTEMYQHHSSAEANAELEGEVEPEAT